MKSGAVLGPLQRTESKRGQTRNPDVAEALLLVECLEEVYGGGAVGWKEAASQRDVVAALPQDRQ